MQAILSTTDYTFVASTKKVTLVAPFNTLDEERILKITNLTTRAIMYDSERRTHMISMAAGVITCTYDSTGMANGDDLQIIADLGVDASIPIHVSTGGAIASTVGDNRKVVTTAGTAVALAASTTIKEVTITAETNNTDIIVVGGSTVVAALLTRRGTPLYPGDSVTVASDNLAEVYIDAMVSTEGVTFTYLV
jgi:hypothetical protein